jgi:outer membrane protein OmpA-like peptidoglycan-associated protein
VYTTLPNRPRYPAAASPATRRSVNPHRLIAGAAALVALIVAGALVALQKPVPIAYGKIVVLENVDADVAGTGLAAIRDPLITSAQRLASTGGGSVIFIAASGGTAQVAARADLKVARDGEAETDAQVRNNAVADRLKSAISAAEPVHVTTPGRNLLPLLAAAAEQAPPAKQPFTIYYVGLGLGTVDPTDARISLAGEPAQAVDGISKQLPKLDGADIHAFFSAAAGPQKPLNTITSAWRTEYWHQLAAAMHARLSEVSTDSTPGPAATGAPAAPPIANIADPTPVPPCRSKCLPPKPDPAPVEFGGGSFKPDSDQFLDRGEAERALAPLAEAWKQHPDGYTRAACTGRTAAFGPASSARALSKSRASQAAAILTSLGVGSVAGVGVGFDDPLPQYGPTDPHQRSVVCTLMPKH